MWATAIQADLEPLSGPRVFGYARWRMDWVKVSSEFAQDRRTLGLASVHDVVNSIDDAGSTRPGLLPTQVQARKNKPAAGGFVLESLISIPGLMCSKVFFQIEVMSID